MLIVWTYLVFITLYLSYAGNFKLYLQLIFKKTLIYRISLLVLFLFQCTYISALSVISSIKENHSIHRELPTKKSSSQDLEFTEDGEEEESESHVLFPFDVCETLYLVNENKASFKDVKQHVLHPENTSKRAVPIIIWVQNFRI